MCIRNPRQSYKRGMRDEPSLGVTSGLRPGPTLDDARNELSKEISRIANFLLSDKYGPLLGVVSMPAVNEFLRSFESTLSRTKGDLTLVCEELIDRAVFNNSKKKS